MSVSRSSTPPPVPVLGAWGGDAPDVSFGVVGSTMMACEDVDTWLEGLHSGVVDGDVLRIVDEAGTEIGTLTRAVGPRAR